MSWSRRFDYLIELPDGRELRTLKDAAEYVLALPREGCFPAFRRP